MPLSSEQASLVTDASKADIEVRRNDLTAMGHHTSYGITQCYLPPGSGDFPSFTPVEGGTQFCDPKGMQG